MNKNLMSVSSRLLKVLNTLFNQANKLTLREVTPTTATDRAEMFEMTVQGGSVASELLESVEGESHRVRLLVRGSANMAYHEWRELREYIDSCFTSVRPDLIPHIDGEVLHEAETSAGLLRREVLGV